jgi:hypothetical protein
MCQKNYLQVSYINNKSTTYYYYLQLPTLTLGGEWSVQHNLKTKNVLLGKIKTIDINI